MSAPWMRQLSPSPHRRIPSRATSDTALARSDDLSPPSRSPNSLARLQDRSRQLIDSTGNFFSDSQKRFNVRILGKELVLCSQCKDIPFAECLKSTPSSFSQRPQNIRPLFTTLTNIMSNRSWCPFCKLLFDSICQEDNDLLSVPHIAEYIKDDTKLKDLTFRQWAEKYSGLKDAIGLGSMWPFGNARDTKSASRSSMEQAEKLFEDAERADITDQSLGNLYGNGTDGTLLGLSAMATVFSNTKQGRDNEAFKQAASIISVFATLKALTGERLPCIFVIRPYLAGEQKSSVLSVRVYAHGRGPLALLKELRHFSLRFATNETPKDLAGQIWYGHELRERIDLEFLRQCLSACQRLHCNGSCSHFQWTAQLPLPKTGDSRFRLVDVKHRRLHVTTFGEMFKLGRKQPALEYTALTYTWGDRPVFQPPPMRTNAAISSSRRPPLLPPRQSSTKLSQENERQWIHSLDQDLPRTIQDAMDIVRGMGLQYLWVDALCIIQDENHADLQVNIECMSHVYGNALFTIVAADSETSNSGIPGVSRSRKLDTQVAEDNIVEGAKMFLPVSMKDIRFDPWETRMWTLQEKLLSRRLLIFAGGYAIWRCAGGVWREDVNAKDVDADFAKNTMFSWNPPQQDGNSRTEVARAGIRKQQLDQSIRLFRTPAYHQYVRTVEDLTRRRIRDHWRVLDAFKGLQAIFGSDHLLASKFRGGLPEKYLDLALLWQPKSRIVRRTIDSTTDLKHTVPPSWSWAGWTDGAIEYPKPYKVLANDAGMQMCLAEHGEERVRPIDRTIYGLTGSLIGGKPLLKNLGLLEMIDKISAKEIRQAWGTEVYDKDALLGNLSDSAAVEVRKALATASAEGKPLYQGQWSQELANISNQLLVVRSEMAGLQLGPLCRKRQLRWQVEDQEYCQNLYDLPSKPSLVISSGPGDQTTIPDASHPGEHWIVDRNGKEAGIVTMHSAQRLSGQVVTAIVLSEAQYLGIETQPDVQGYPLYNVMIVAQNDRRGYYERVGLGKVYKYAWDECRREKGEFILR